MTMEPIKKIAVGDDVVAEVDIRVWPKCDFAIRFGKDEILFRCLGVRDQIAHCEVLEGNDVLRKLREDAA